MAGKRDKPEEIVAKLRQVEVLHGEAAAMLNASARSVMSAKAASNKARGVAMVWLK